MSVETLKVFFENVEGDKALQEKVKALATKFTGHKDEGIAELVKIAAETGIKFTVADFKDAAAQARELSRDELIWLERRFELKSTCGYPPCGGAAYTCPTATW